MSDIKKVAVYCRVSTDKFEQKESLENQILYFNSLIKNSNEY